MLFTFAFAVLIAVATAAEPIVNCLVPISPEHGQSFLYQQGKTVKYVCEPGYKLQGKEIISCLDGQWEEPTPTCLEMNAANDPILTEEAAADPLAPPPPSRPLFSWGLDEPESEPELEKNSTEDESPQGDEARVRMVLYPSRRIVTSRVRTARLQSGSELEAEEKKRSSNKEKSSSTTIHLQAPPSTIYVRRTLNPSNTNQASSEQYREEALHMRLDENGDTVQVVSMPRAAVFQQSDKAGQSEEARRQMYWYAHQYYYPRQSSLLEYQENGSPVAMTLSDSQINWINSLHPELRDQYLRDMYITRAGVVDEQARAHAFMGRYGYRYGDAYNMMYGAPLYHRQPVSLVVEDPVQSYDYSCHQAYSPFVRAPKLPNAHVARYDRRQNPNTPNNHYLSAIYRCNSGYVMLDTRFTELHCSKRRWSGTMPVCVRSG